MPVTPFRQYEPEPATFETFWKWFPKKVGKPLAMTKWKAITNGGLTTRTMDRDSGQFVEIELSATPEELIEGAKRYRREQTGEDYKLKDGGKYTCHPATWLNQGRWMDG